MPGLVHGGAAGPEIQCDPWHWARTGDIEATRATLVALGLIAAQPVPMLAHSNIDDGYAAQFTDLTSSLGMMEIERHIVEDLIGAKMSHLQLQRSMLPLIEAARADEIVSKLIEGALAFRDNVLASLNDAAIDTTDALEILLALQRIGARTLERLYGVGQYDNSHIGGRRPVVAGSVLEEIGEMADVAMADADPDAVAFLRGRNMRVIVATTDVHEHGKMLIEEILRRSDVEVLDGGVSTDVQQLVDNAAERMPDALAVSTYNGVALSYYAECKAALAEKGLDIPILIGGRLNQIPEDSNTSLPVDVGGHLAQSGAIVCRNASEMISRLRTIAAADDKEETA